MRTENMQSTFKQHWRPVRSTGALNGLLQEPEARETGEKGEEGIGQEGGIHGQRHTDRQIRIQMCNQARVSEEGGSKNSMQKQKRFLNNCCFV